VKRSTILWTIAGFAALALLVYGASLSNAFVRWDDGLLIYENPAIRGITPHTLKTIFTTYDPELYIPLTFFTYQIDYLISGAHPTIYHIQNLLWHIGNALLVAWLAFLLLRKILQPDYRNPDSFVLSPLSLVLCPLFCGLLFLVHPLHTEAVAWASARKDVVSTFFFLGSIIFYLRWRVGGKKGTYILSLIALILGLLAKVTVLTLPVVLLLIDFREGRRWSWNMLTEKIPYAALTVLFGIIAWIGKVGVLGSSTLQEKILMAPRSAVFYLEKIFLPIHLSVLYPFSGEVTLARLDILIPFLLFCALIVFALLSLKWTCEIFFAIAFFLVTVSPTLGNFAKGDFLYFASDRYAYIPSIGIIFLIGLIAALCAQQFPKRRKTFAIGGMIIIGLMAIGAFRQSLLWRDSPSLFGNVLALYPESYVAENNLGNFWRTEGEETKALESYTHALQIMENEGRSGTALNHAQSKTLANIASLQRSQGNLTQAKATLSQAIALNPENPYALLSLGIIAQQEGRSSDAEDAFRKAIADAPTFAAARLNLGALLIAENRLDEGITAYREALAINPFFPQAQFNLAVALEKQNRMVEAEDAYQEAIAIESTYSAARINLALLLYNDHRPQDAITQFQEILKYDPGNAQATSALKQMGE